MFARPSIRLIVLLVGTLALAVPVKSAPPPGPRPPKADPEEIQPGRLMLTQAKYYTDPGNFEHLVPSLSDVLVVLD